MDNDSGAVVGVRTGSSETGSSAAIVRRVGEGVAPAQQPHGQGLDDGGKNTHSAAAYYSEEPAAMMSSRDSNSEEFILHKSDKELEGITCRKEYTVQYSVR